MRTRGIAFVAACLGASAHALAACGSFEESGADGGAAPPTSDAAARDGTAPSIDASSPDGALPIEDAATLDAARKRVYLVGVVPSAGLAQGATHADEKCRSALAGTPGARATAWVSGPGPSSPLDRLGSAAGPWYTPSGRLVFADRAALTSSMLSSAIDEGASGEVISPSDVWTGVLEDGSPSGVDCLGWAHSIGFVASVGRTGSMNAAWTNARADADCTGVAYLVCLEQ